MTPDAGKEILVGECVQDVLEAPALVIGSAEGNGCARSARETEKGSGPVERGAGAAAADWRRQTQTAGEAVVRYGRRGTGGGTSAGLLTAVVRRER